MMYTPSKILEAQYNKYWENDRVVIVCDDYVNCFDARLVWIELERKGAEYLWVYFKTWVVK